MARVEGPGRQGGSALAALRDNPALPIIAALFVVIFGGWEFVVVTFQVPRYVAPPPSQMFLAFMRGILVSPLARDSYWLHAGYTAAEALQGFFLGSLVGILAGTIISQSRILETMLKPYIVAFQSLPKVAVAPLFVLWFGAGMTSKVVICSLLTFFPLMVNSLVGFKSVEEERVDLVRSLSASRWQVFRMIELPSSLPFIFAGLDMAIVYAVIGAIVGEFVGAQTGLGVLVLHMNFAGDMAAAFSIFIMLSLLGITLNTTLNFIRRRVLFWAPAERKQRPNRP